jgi:hypothetical protein
VTLYEMWNQHFRPPHNNVLEGTIVIGTKTTSSPCNVLNILRYIVQRK